ncbi:Axonemal dynein light chain [Cinara cedri]|uniref:Axonemal dynein light chain n=1 Tax=Cinara cedri TaxID=506608 RepID=A0A5E4MDT7_9HEMI|nr:Axonemal dynein light chain [Cinara cedri]
MEKNQKILPFEINLVRFENPETLVEKSNKTLTKKNILSSKTKVNLFGSEDGAELTCGDVLNLIVEPRQWRKDDVDWKQDISKQPGTTSDVKKLSEKLDTYLLQFEAKEQRQKKTDLKNLAEILKLENQILAADLINTTNITVLIEQGLAEKNEKELQMHINRLEVLKKSNGLIKDWSTKLL